MTTEDDFHQQLDVQPDDWQTRLVFADWLEDRGDPRAEGYRALGVMRKYPYYGDPTPSNDAARRASFLEGWSFWGAGATGTDPYHLPDDWRHVLPTNGRAIRWGTWRPTRRGAEDAAALAFAKLPAARRAELLASTPGLQPLKESK